MSEYVGSNEVFGLLRPSIDAHTLGISTVADLLRDCRYQVSVADEGVCRALDSLHHRASIDAVERWIRQNRVSRLGFSYRLDPRDGADRFKHILEICTDRRLWISQGGPVCRAFFAGLPAACELISQWYGHAVPVFHGDETPGQTLRKLGVPESRLPQGLAGEHEYDTAREVFARAVIMSGQYASERPVDRRGYAGFGTRHDSLLARITHGWQAGLPPLMRAHVGPYGEDREEAVRQFVDWTKQLAASGMLDVLSIGTSQLTQVAFGQEWGDKPNGGGVPVNSEDEYRAIWEAARPMLVRTYAGTRDVPGLAELHDRVLHNAWHALSFWWFCHLDGRGPNDLATNLREHFAVLRHAAEAGRPVEPNVPHHFAFRGADDVTYVVAGALAAGAARRVGVRTLVLQTMLNTPKHTWGVQDLAKCRALLRLVREDGDRGMRVVLQPRAGLDYLSHDTERAKAQLASASALMDDIEPEDSASPPIVHVVSYSEGSHLATPDVVDDSIRITRFAIAEYRRARHRGDVPDMAHDAEVEARTEELVDGARTVLAQIGRSIDEPYSPVGLCAAFEAGFLPVPALWGSRDAYPNATHWRTKLIDGGVKVVDDVGRPVPVAERAAEAAELARSVRGLVHA